jgi:hypothetical protein
MPTPWADALSGTNIAKPRAMALTKMADDVLIAWFLCKLRKRRLGKSLRIAVHNCLEYEKFRCD